MRARPLACVVALSASVFALASCGSSNDDSTSSSAPNGAAGASGAASNGTGGSGMLGLGGSPGTTSTAPCATSCDGGQVCLNGACACPTYQKMCGGSCIAVVNDPSHCGDCNTVCASPQVCSGGTCTAACLPGETACGTSCVDTATDGANCGMCGKTCPSGQGCVLGQCAASTVIASPASCANGGPTLTTTVAGNSVCLGNLGAAAFGSALCSCHGIEVSDMLLMTDSFDSTKAPYAPGTPGGDVGANEALNVNGSVQIGGSLAIGDPKSLNVRALDVGGDLYVSGPLGGTGPTTVGGDAFVNGAIQSSDPVMIHGALTQPAGTENASSVTYGSRIEMTPSLAVPCACGANDVLPIAAIVAAAATENDDDALGLNPDVLANLNSPARLDLPCGSFFLSAIDDNAPVVVAVHGRTALYVGGNVGIRETSFVLDPDAELSVFVGGDVDLDAPLVLGSPEYPALARMYVAGKFSVNATVTTSGFVYAPNATFDLNDQMTVYGGIFAGQFGGRSTTVHYDAAIRSVGTGCAAPSSTSGPG